MYDTQLIKDVQEIVELINNKEWKKAESKIYIEGKEYQEIELGENEEMEQ